jgi:uncharacterized protein (DUF169 family)
MPINYDALHKQINHIIKPKGGSPLGIKLFSDKETFSALKMKKPKQPLALCEALKIASVYEQTFGIQTEDITTCALGNYILGFAPLPDDTMQKWITLYKYTPKLFDALLKNGHTLPLHKYVACLLFPLRSADVLNLDPDIVFLPVNSAQAMLLVLGFFEGEHVKPSSDFYGHMACEIVAAGLTTQTLWLTIPCGGARTLAGVQDDELWITMPPKQLASTIKRLKEIETRYPLIEAKERISKLF